MSMDEAGGENRNCPRHVAIIMDGNGRWATHKGLPRFAGHRAGMEAIKRCLDAVGKYPVEHLTLFAFSTENWKRPQKEVRFLMALPQQFVKAELDNLIRNNIRMHVVGDVCALPAATRKAIERGVNNTSQCTGLQLTFAINYGGRDEIVRAARNLCSLVKDGQLSPEQVDEALFCQHVYKPEFPDPDLIIRTSGETRLSNFMLWRGAYSELMFTETLWPDFSEDDVDKAINYYESRKRQFGAIF